jgi:antimicrobial peptide system SdpB family protein
VKHRRFGLGLLTIGIGSTVLMVYVQHFRMRGFLWGDDGVFPWQTFATGGHWIRSLYAICGAAWFHTALYLCGTVVTAAFTLGWRTRITTVLFWLFTWSLYTRNSFVLDGGDNLIYLLAFYMMFADCSGAASLDAARVRRRSRKRGDTLIAMFHNYAILAMMLQICLLYFTSGLFKAEGHVWQDGTAVYYVLRSTEFNLSPLGPLCWRSAAVVTLLTWSTVVFEISWPFLIWFQKTRFLVVCGAVLLHAMIGYFMGLAWFSLVMISAQAVALGDSEYLRAAGVVRRALSMVFAQAEPTAVASGR